MISMSYGCGECSAAIFSFTAEVYSQPAANRFSNVLALWRKMRLPRQMCQPCGLSAFYINKKRLTLSVKRSIICIKNALYKSAALPTELHQHLLHHFQRLIYYSMLFGICQAFFKKFFCQARTQRLQVSIKRLVQPLRRSYLSF